MTTPTQAPMRAYKVQFKRGQQVVREFPAMGPDSVTVVNQHMDLAHMEQLKLEVCSLWGDIPGTEGRASV